MGCKAALLPPARGRWSDSFDDVAGVAWDAPAKIDSCSGARIGVAVDGSPSAVSSAVVVGVAVSGVPGLPVQAVLGATHQLGASSGFG